MDLRNWVRGGPARWKTPVTTAGKLGPDDRAYTVDTLAVPADNPWKSWLRPSAIDFLSDGRLAVASMDGDVWMVSGIDAARGFVAEGWRVLRPRGVFFIVVPDYLKERGFFWDIDYTHNFITTERRVRQLLHDGGFEIVDFVRSIGLATGITRDLLAGASMLANMPGIDPLSRYTGTAELLYKVRKNLFETLAFVARRP